MSTTKTRTDSINTEDLGETDADEVRLELEKTARSEAALRVDDGRQQWTLTVDNQHRVHSDEELPAWLETLLGELGFWLAD